jgi:hypothetical protein
MLALERDRKADTAAWSPAHPENQHVFHEPVGWCCQFLEDDLETRLARKITLENPTELSEIPKRGSTPKVACFGVARWPKMKTLYPRTGRFH